MSVFLQCLGFELLYREYSWSVYILYWIINKTIKIKIQLCFSLTQESFFYGALTSKVKKFEMHNFQAIVFYFTTKKIYARRECTFKKFSDVSKGVYKCNIWLTWINSWYLN